MGEPAFDLDDNAVARRASALVVMMPDRAERVIAFIELLTVPSGKGAGAPFVLDEFQKRFIRDIYTPHRADNRRLVQRAILSIARKNGKTALIAALVLVHLIGPEAIPNGEIYSCANDLEQAAVVFKFCAQIVRLDPELEAVVKITDHKKRMDVANGSFYRALSRDAKSKHGLSPSVYIYDELAQSRDRELYDTMDTATGAREEPLGVVISTQSKDPEHIMSELVDDGLNEDDPTTVCHLYAVPDECEDIYNEDVWKLANPASFVMVNQLRNAAARAKRNPSFENSFRNLHLNQRVDVNAPLFARSVWTSRKRDECDLIPGEAIYLGLDLATTTDLAALVAVSADDGSRVKAWFWTPQHGLELRSKTDRAPYKKWEKLGFLQVSPGKIIDHATIASFIGSLSKQYEVKGVGFDRWRIRAFEKTCQEEKVDITVDPKPDEEISGIRFVGIGQGFQDMTPCIEYAEREINSDHGLIHDGHPVLTYCISNAAPITDPAGNRKLDKSRRNLRIDGAVALVMALGLKSRDLEVETTDWDDIIENSVDIGLG